MPKSRADDAGCAALHMSSNISNSFPEGFRELQQNPGSRGSIGTAGRMDAERAPNTLLFLAHAATDLMLRAVRLVLFVFWKEFTNYDKMSGYISKIQENLILVRHVYLDLVCLTPTLYLISA